MITSFAQFAAASLMGSQAAPPRQDGQLLFRKGWEQAAFGVAIALAKQGYYEWEDFRQCLIQTIGAWEGEHTPQDPRWDYYQCWLQALATMAIASGVLEQAELESRIAALLHCDTAAIPAVSS